MNCSIPRWARSIPNALTILRLLLIPGFIYAYYTPNLWIPDRLLALGVFLFANFTDVLDGYLARKLNAISNFGRLADPVADKLITLAALVCLFESKRIKWWFLAIVVGKDLCMLIGSYIMLKFRIVVYSKWYGKAATFLMSSGIVLTFWTRTYPFNTYLLYVSLGFSLYAFVHYVRLAFRQLREVHEHPDNPRDIYAEED